MADEPWPESQPRPPRRPRYRGKHPRRFEEKYKEHNPDRYGDEIAKIVASGKTPAGMHRPILVTEILGVLNPQPGEWGVDATLGFGGHAGELLERIRPDGKLLALDIDPLELPKTELRMRAAGHGADALVVSRCNFAGLPGAMTEAGYATGADFILADLGQSSMQIDNPTRGFTFKWDGPFDLRMNPARGQPASAFVAGLSVEKLTSLLIENADEPRAAQLAPVLCEAARSGRLETTLAVARVIRATLDQGNEGRHPPQTDEVIRRVFQAVRIAVNDEFGALEMLLRHLPGCLKSRGRAAILTFHSGEDRRVKNAFRLGRDAGVYAQIADEVIRPSASEIQANPRAKSAKLRWAVRADET